MTNEREACIVPNTAVYGGLIRQTANEIFAGKRIGKVVLQVWLTERTPDYTLFTKVRSYLGIERIELIFNCVKTQLQEKGYASEQLVFVDSTALISKVTVWEEKDKLIEKGIEEVNNTTLPEAAHDKEAKIGCKGKDKFWYGYKAHNVVDMESGVITAVDVTPANVSDADAIKGLGQFDGYVYADKGYVGAIEGIILRGGTPRVILKNNMQDKDPLTLAKVMSRRLIAVSTFWQKFSDVSIKKLSKRGIHSTRGNRTFHRPLC